MTDQAIIQNLSTNRLRRELQETQERLSRLEDFVFALYADIQWEEEVGYHVDQKYVDYLAWRHKRNNRYKVENKDDPKD